MIRALLVLLGSVGSMTLSLSAASAQAPKDVGKKAGIELTEPTRVGRVMLVAGRYAVEHQVVDGKHYLVFRSQTIESARGGLNRWMKTAKQEAARVPCRLVSIDRSGEDVVLTRLGSDGTRELVEIRFRNTLWTHAVVFAGIANGSGPAVNEETDTAVAVLLALDPNAALAAAAQHAHGAAPAPPPETRPLHDDAWYVSAMLMHDEHGIEMAQAAAEEGQRQDVKDLAARMVERQGAEQKRLQELKAMLGQSGSMTTGGGMPGMHDMSGMAGMGGMSGKHGQHMADRQKLQAASGGEADGLFLRTMAEHLTMGIDLAKQAKNGLQNARVREFAAASNAALARELDEVKKLERVTIPGK